jgi:hypothetical protein
VRGGGETKYAAAPNGTRKVCGLQLKRASVVSVRPSVRPLTRVSVRKEETQARHFVTRGHHSSVGQFRLTVDLP